MAAAAAAPDEPTFEDGVGGVSPIELPALAFDLAFHPKSFLLAAGTITGSVFVYLVGDDGESDEAFKVDCHGESCRQVVFGPDGQNLFSTGVDRAIQATDVETGKALGTLTGAHGSAINALHAPDATTLVSGDDDGMVKVWDLRERSCIAEFNEHGDYISGIATCEHHGEVVASSGDGTLSVMDVRAKDIEMSYRLEDEPLCLAIIKGGSRVVCGTQEGPLGLYTWGKWEDVSDRMVGHPASVDCITKLSEDTVVTGSSDGMIRLVDIMPHRIRGVVGEHEGFPIEALEVNGEGNLLASCSHDKLIKFWDVKGLGHASAAPVAGGSSGGGGGGGFFDDL